MPLEIVSHLPKLANADLLEFWRRRQKESNSARWNSLVKGQYIPQTQEDRDDIHLREELRKRGLFTEKVLSL